MSCCLAVRFPLSHYWVRGYQMPLDLPPGGARIRAEDLFGMLSSNWAPGKEGPRGTMTLFAMRSYTTRCRQTLLTDPLKWSIIAKLFQCFGWMTQQTCLFSQNAPTYQIGWSWTPGGPSCLRVGCRGEWACPGLELPSPSFLSWPPQPLPPCRAPAQRVSQPEPDGFHRKGF